MKLRVLQLIDSFNQGGTERQAVQLTRLLAEAGQVEVRLACLNRSGVLLAEVNSFGLGEIPEFPLSSFLDLNFLRQLRAFVRYLRAERIDILQTHDFYTNIFGMLAGFLARVPVRIAAKRETGGMRSGLQAAVERRAYTLAHAVVVNAAAVASVLVQQGVAQHKIHVVYNGLDAARLAVAAGSERSAELAALGLDQTVALKLVTIVANLRSEVKDQRTFLRAAKLVLDQCPDAGFVLAGEGDLLGPLRSFAGELGIAERTFFIGRCSEVARLLAQSEVCVLSSTNEGFSNSIIEYMYAARPVVTTDVGGAREALVEDETGYIVPVGDAQQMADRIILLLRDGAHARVLGQAGQRVAREKFSSAAQLARTMNLYAQLVSSRSGLAARLNVSIAGRV